MYYFFMDNDALFFWSKSNKKISFLFFLNFFHKSNMRQVLPFAFGVFLESYFRDFTLLSRRQSKAYHWNQEANLSLVVHLLKLYIKLMLRLIHIFIRYEIMRTYMPKVGTLGLDMMFRTCTIQVSIWTSALKWT